MKATGFTCDFSKGLSMIRASLEESKGDVRVAIVEVANEIKYVSQTLVPVDTTTLRQSAYMTTDIQDEIMTCIIGYGGPDSPTNPKSGKVADEYAVEVHEDIFTYHGNGEAKFLEIPTLVYQYNAEEVLRDKLNK